MHNNKGTVVLHLDDFSATLKVPFKLVALDLLGHAIVRGSAGARDTFSSTFAFFSSLSMRFSQVLWLHIKMVNEWKKRETNACTTIIPIQKHETHSHSHNWAYYGWHRVQQWCMPRVHAPIWFLGTPAMAFSRIHIFHKCGMRKILVI